MTRCTSGAGRHGGFARGVGLLAGASRRGRIIEVYGPESSGKTTLALHILAEAQKQGGEVAFIDVEHALDPTYAEALGVDINNLLVSQPDTGEQAMEICEALVLSHDNCRAYQTNLHTRIHLRRVCRR